jgi:DNA-binding IclR family transcriptional regulator
MAVDEGANGRIIKVINFLTAHPEEAFTVSQLAEQLGMSFGSAHRVLTALTEAGYLARHAKHKTYTLGLALLAIGQVAMQRHKVVAIAQREMDKLTTELELECLISAISGNEILYLAKTGKASAPNGVTRVGDRRPYLPPLGLCHIAWADAARVESYLQRAPSGLSPSMQDYLKQALAVVRKRGYSIALMGQGINALRQLVADHVYSYSAPQYWQELDRAIAALSPAEIQALSPADLGGNPISHISVPVFSASGDVLLELTLAGFPDALSTAEMERIGTRMVNAASQVTRETYGRKPMN